MILVKPPRVLAGACTTSPGSNYNDDMCADARAASEALTCEIGGYPYYSCNRVNNPTSWKYCWGCHASDGTVPPVGSGTIDPYCPPGTTVTPDYTVTPQCALYKFLRNCVLGPVCGRRSQGDQNFCYAYTCVPTCFAPAAPTLASPADLASLASTSVNLLWNSVAFTSGCTGEYKVYVGTANPPTTLLATVDASTLNYNFTGVNGTTYYWYVSASNGGQTANSSVRSFTILENQIAGTVFYDASNNCGGSGLSGVSISLDSGAGTAVSGTGTYSLTASVGASHTLAVGIPAGYSCSTAAGCSTCSRSGISSPSVNNNFYLTDLRESWWQVAGAGVYSGGDVLWKQKAFSRREGFLLCESIFS